MNDAYRLEYGDKASEQLDHLDRKIARQIVRKLEWLTARVAEHQHETMTGNWSGFFRLRVSDYRVIYSLNHPTKTIEIEAVGHRSDVYRR